MRRPKLTARKWEWRSPTGNIAGIGLMRGYHLNAHLTPDEAITLANRLVDLAEQMQHQEQEANHG